MRLLNTRTGEFEWHNDPRRVPYAILSHVWREPDKGGEQTYNDVCRIQAAVKAAEESGDILCTVHWPQFPHRDDSSPSDNLYTSTPIGISDIFSVDSPLSNKIKGLCKVARDAGFRLVWDDTCCIDKSSSAELSEAINSMYDWYQLSNMCYVYLADVPEGDSPQDKTSRFRQSRWHRRGWTLQELIAPERIEFRTQSWSFLGTKLGLVDVLAAVTGIDAHILAGGAPVSTASVAQRMSWAAVRNTTRTEDEAYCLMGLFGVHMTPIYGEGHNAFLRLQEEIIRTVPDQSIFAWGRRCILGSRLRPHAEHTPGDHELHTALLALSPSFFSTSTLQPVAPTELALRLCLESTEDVPPLDCTFAPQGARIRLLCLDLKKIPNYDRIFLPRKGDNRCECPVRHDVPDLLALLQCEDANGNLAALPLHPPPAASPLGRGRPVNTYIPSQQISSSSLCRALKNPWFHTVLLSRQALAEFFKYVKPEAVEVCFLRHYSEPPSSKLLRQDDSIEPLGDRWSSSSFFWKATPYALSPRSIAHLGDLGFTVSDLHVRRDEKEKIMLETVLTLHGTGEVCLQSIRLSISFEQSKREAFYTMRRFTGLNQPNSCFSRKCTENPTLSP